MAYQFRPTKAKKTHRLRRWLFAVVPLLLIAGAVYWFVWGGNKAEAPTATQQQSSTEEPQQSEEPAYEPIALQSTVDAWATKQGATYHIVVYDVQAKKNIAAVEPDTSLFAASLYKIYVAYLSLMDFQSGAQDPNDILIAGQTKKQCVDKMIRSSDSPCGEAMMAEIGQATLNKRVKDLGMTSTFFNGIRTSAADSAKILELIQSKKHLDDKNTAFLLDAMKDQPDMYERGLKMGAPDASWQTKVGWNENDNYHDIGIMTLPDDRVFVVAILSQGQGSSKPIANFAETIYEALTL